MTWEWLTQTQKHRKEELEKILNLQKMWALRRPILDAHILSLQKKVQRLESEIDDILMEELRNLNKYDQHMIRPETQSTQN